MDADNLYKQAVTEYGEALNRLAKAYESDPDRCKDLLQDIHAGIWRSFKHFNGQCSLRTWVYRVAHNIATSTISRRRSKLHALVGLDHVEDSVTDDNIDLQLDRKRAKERLFALIQRLKPADRQIMLLYLEGLDASAIAEITGLSAGAIGVKVHRIKNILVRRFHERKVIDAE